MPIIALHHVQLAMPAGQEDLARSFYAGLLGLHERPKPAALTGRGGVWFQGGEAQIHLGVARDFRPATKAHPGFLLSNSADLDALLARLRKAGVAVTQDENLPGYRRAYIADPFGNRIEVMARE